MRQAIYERIVVETRPADLPKHWKFLPRSHHVRRLCGQPCDLAATLTAAFPLEELLAAGVLVRGRGDQALLTPVLGDAAAKFVVLHDANRKASDFLSARGAVSNGDPPFLQYAMARHAEGASQDARQIVLSPTDDDLQVLHQLKWPCTSAAGLAQTSWRARPQNIWRQQF